MSALRTSTSVRRVLVRVYARTKMPPATIHGCGDIDTCAELQTAAMPARVRGGDTNASWRRGMVAEIRVFARRCGRRLAKGRR
jgi:hypothetical protein